MPIYLYRCGACEQTCEALQHTSDAPLVECPHCHAQALHKIIAPCGVIFKGHGFYKTDNPSGSAPENTADRSANQDAGTTSSAAASSEAPASEKVSKAPETASSSASEASKAAEHTSSASHSAKEHG
ncbi:MAG: zinc ribbon domain-containing protein [bacterium]|nr:zinc ribbon domain-containing protein [bacterium]